MASPPATQIISGVRSVLAKHWIDLNALRMTVTRAGTVRIAGEVLLLPGRFPREPGGSKMDLIQADIRRVHGVLRVRFLDSATAV